MTVKIEEAQLRLVELISRLKKGEYLDLEVNGQIVAKVIRQELQPRTAGSAAHLDHWMAPDFDAPMEDMHECMQ